MAGFIGSPAMNFVTAELTRDDGPVVTFAGYKLPVPPAVIDGKPGLDGYFGRKIILGIRPSDFEDAALADAGWARMQVTAGVTEELGSEIHVIFTIDAPPVEHASITDAATGDSGEDESVAALVGGKSLWTARVVRPVQGPPQPAGRARGRHRQPAVLRRRQRPVHRPPESAPGRRGAPSGIARGLC